MSTVDVRLLGHLEVAHLGDPVPLGGPKQRTVLALLLLRPGELVTTDRLVTELWGDDPPASARRTLHSYVSNLRKALGDAARIEGLTGGYVLHLDVEEVDATRFARLVATARDHAEADPPSAVSLLDQALALWRGRPFGDLADEPPLRTEVARLEELYVAAVEARIAARLGAGEVDGELIAELEQLTATHPLRERLWADRILALYRAGRQADALHAYDELRRLLADELGIDPSPELQQLHERVLRQDPALASSRSLRGYQLLEVIGEGPRGVVHRAIQPHLGREVALKAFHPRTANDADFVRVFEVWAQAIARLDHPHIAPVYDYWREPGAAYVVTRLYARSLADLLGDGPVPAERLARILDQVAEALAYAHTSGVVHGALTPSNVLLSADDHAALTDFALGAPNPAGADADLDALAALRRLGDGVAPSPRAAPPTEAPFPTVVRNPYKGLRPFLEADAADFHGRTALTEHLVDRLRGDEQNTRFLAVVGPSGSGKSSVVRAGLVPALRTGALPGSERWLVVELLPGRDPLHALHRALLGVAVDARDASVAAFLDDDRGLLECADRLLGDGDGELLVVVDQFEEVFTLAHDEWIRGRFLANLATAVTEPGSRVRVVVTLRSDQYDAPLRDRRIAALFRDHVETVVPMTSNELETTIVGPLQGTGVSIEPGLAARMVADVVERAGALPLLQYALAELFDRRTGDVITAAGYEAIGGAAGALARRADELYLSLDDDARAAIRQLVLRLVTIDESGAEARRRVRLSEVRALGLDPQTVDAGLAHLGNHRMLSFDHDAATREPTVEVAHEALLREWHRLRGWIDDARDDVRQRRRLQIEAAEWEDGQREPSYLLRGARLDEFTAWAAQTRLALTDAESAFLHASTELRDAEVVEETGRQEREAQLRARSIQRLRALVAVLTVAALTASALTAFAFAERRRAAASARIAMTRELTNASISVRDSDPQLGMLLALEAIDRARTAGDPVLAETEGALRHALHRTRVELTFADVTSIDHSPDGSRLATTGNDRTVRLHDAATGEELSRFAPTEANLTHLRFSPDGGAIAATGRDGTVHLWEAKSGRLRWMAEGHPTPAVRLAFSPAGDALATISQEGSILVWDATTGTVRHRLGAGGQPTGLAISADGILAVVAGDVGLWDVETGAVLAHPHETGSLVNWAHDVAFSPDGQVLAVAGTGLDAITMLDPDTLRVTAKLTGHGPAGAFTVAFNADGTQVASAGMDGVIQVWPWDGVAAPPTGPSHVLPTAGRAATSLSWSVDDSRLAAATAAATEAQVWGLRDVDASVTGLSGFTPTDDGIHSLAYLPTGELLIGDGIGAVHAFDRAGGQREQLLQAHLDAGLSALAVSPDGRTVATGGFDGMLKLWDARTWERLAYDRRVAGAQTSLAFDPSGRFLAVGSMDLHAEVLKVDRAALDGGALKENSGFIDTVMLRDDLERGFWAIAWDPTGERIATGGNDATIRLWDRDTADPVATLPGHTAWVNDLLFTPDGELVSASDDGTIRVWTQEGDTLATLLGHRSRVRDVALSVDGRYLASAGSDGVRLWDAATGEALGVIAQTDVAASAVAFDPDGRYLAYGDISGRLRVDPLDLDAVIELARDRLRRDLTDQECVTYLHRSDGCDDTSA